MTYLIQPILPLNRSSQRGINQVNVELQEQSHGFNYTSAGLAKVFRRRKERKGIRRLPDSPKKSPRRSPGVTRGHTTNNQRINNRRLNLTLYCFLGLFTPQILLESLNWLNSNGENNGNN